MAGGRQLAGRRHLAILVPSTILLFFVPGGFEGYLREMGEPVVEGQPPPSGPIDFEKAARIGPKYGLEIVRPERDQ